MTSRWSNRVFCFLVAVTVVNIQNAGCYFLNLSKIDALFARKMIAEQFIHNKYLQKPPDCRRSARKVKVGDCRLVALPPQKNSRTEMRFMTTPNTTVGSVGVVMPM